MKGKIVVFGIGKIFHEHINLVDLSKIEFFADNDSGLWGSRLLDKEVLSPTIVQSKNFDWIVIFSNQYFYTIYNQLVYEMQIPSWKVIDYKTYFYRNQQFYKNIVYDELKDLFSMLRAYKYNSLLDVGMTIAKSGFFHKSVKQLFASQNIKIDAYVEKAENIFPIYTNIYDNIYSQFSLPYYKYDVALFTEWGVDISWEKYKNLIMNFGKYARFIIFKIALPYTEKEKKVFQYPFGDFGQFQLIRSKFFYLFVLDQKQQQEPFDLKIYVVTHKIFFMPNVSSYIPIHAGKVNGIALGYLGDDSGDNISELNPYINECTALYWIWKHEDCKYVGLNHYRRYFLRNAIVSRDNIIDEASVKKILEIYDIILPEEFSFYPNTVGDSVKYDTDEELYDKAYHIIRSLLKAKQKSYIESFDYIMSGYVFYRANLFITHKSIIDKYCEWLFSFIIDAIQMLDVQDYSVKNQRMVGFFAERMFTVWLMKQELKIKEMPIIEIK